MSTMIDIKYLQAELASLDDLLANTAESDFITRRSFKYRREQVLTELEQMQNKFDTTAEVVLYFGGEPVQGSSAIKTSFASDALAKFQDLVSTIYSSLMHDLANSGPLPSSSGSSLNIIALAKGSFGFVLQEDTSKEQLSLVPTNVSKAIDEAGKLIKLSSEDDEDKIIDEISNTNERVLASLQKFTDTLSLYEASFSFETKTLRVSIPKNKISTIKNNITNIEINDSTVILDGIFKGATKLTRKFDFEPTGDEVKKISGTISKEFPEDHIYLMNTEYMDKPCRIKFSKTQTTKRNSSSSRTKWVLIDIIGK